MSALDHEPRDLVDKSLFYYGNWYNKLFDPLIKPAREAVVDVIPVNASVLDIGCGTGLLCFDLKREKDCQVVGIDLSRRMLAFAQSLNPYDDLQFLHRDATNLKGFNDQSFDYVVILNVIHELKPEQQQKMLREALRVGEKIILFDANVPLPWNAVGIVKRIIEISFGLDHYPQFRSFLSSGGILGILEKAGYSANILDRSILSQGSNLLVLVSS